MSESTFKKESELTAEFLRARNFDTFKCLKPPLDPPDVLVRFRDKIVGVEVTRLLYPNLKEQDSLFESISDRIIKELHQTGINDLIIRLTLDYKKKIWRDDCVAMVVNACVENYNFIGLDFIDLTNKDWESIVLLKVKKWDKPSKITHDSRMKFSGPIHEKRLQMEIEKKVLSFYNQLMKTL